MHYEYGLEILPGVPICNQFGTKVRAGRRSGSGKQLGRTGCSTHGAGVNLDAAHVVQVSIWMQHTWCRCQSGAGVNLDAAHVVQVSICRSILDVVG
jgi:hypothetical protein